MVLSCVAWVFWDPHQSPVAGLLYSHLGDVTIDNMAEHTENTHDIQAEPNTTTTPRS